MLQNFKNIFRVREAEPPKPPGSWGALPLAPLTEAQPPGTGRFWTESAWSTGYHLSLVSVSDSGLQKYRKYQKLKILLEEKRK